MQLCLILLFHKALRDKMVLMVRRGFKAQQAQRVLMVLMLP